MKENSYPYNLLTIVLDNKKEQCPPAITPDICAGIEYAFSFLEKVEIDILKLHYQDDLDYFEIAERLNIGYDELRQIEYESIKKLKSSYCLNYIEYGVAGYLQRVRTAEYKKGYDTGYKTGYKDCEIDIEKRNTFADRDMALMKLPLESLGLPPRPTNCLLRSGCRTIGDCVILDYTSICKIRSLGIKCAVQIASALHSLDIHNTDWDRFLERDNNLLGNQLP